MHAHLQFVRARHDYRFEEVNRIILKTNTTKVEIIDLRDLFSNNFMSAKTEIPYYINSENE